MNEDVIKVQLSCGVDYYKGDKGDKPIKGVDYFTQEDIADIVEQIETGGVDLDGYATKEYVDNAVSGVVVSETDPTVPEWAKQANKPSYTASEVGALPADTQLFSGNYNDLRNKPAIPTVPANVSAFNNDAGYLTSHQSLSGYATKAYVDEAIENIDTSGGITVETDPTVPSWAKQANKPTYTAQEVGALPANTALFSGDYNDLSNKPTLPPAPIVIQTTIAGQPSVVDGVYTLPLTITSNNMAEAYAQYQTHPSTVGMAVDLTALGRATKMYLDCESFYRYGNDSSGYTYETFGEFNDNSLSQSFGYEFMNVNVHLNTGGSGSRGTVVGVATVHQLASKANSADLATVATSGDYNDLTNKPTIPTAYTLPTASTSTLGGVKVDGSTITIDGNGVISSSGGSSYTFTNGLTERDGTVSWNLNSRIRAGSGSDSVVIGNNNTASGYYAFAQGSGNQANGIASHAEGNTTRAWGPYSHAEGSNIIASGSHQHAEGKFNIEDSNSILQNIAGNGSSSARATMFARDWNGNEYLSGNLFVGCNDFTTTSSGLTTANAGGSKVATMSDLTADNITYYFIVDEDPETGDPIRSETANTLTDALDSVQADIEGILSGEQIDTSMISAGTDKTTGNTIHLDSVLSDMETAISNAGGGSSYTAGDGINIDSNNVISADIYSFFRKNTSNQLIGIMNTDYPPKNTGTYGFNIGISINSNGARGKYSMIIGQDNETSSTSIWAGIWGSGSVNDGRNSYIIGTDNSLREDKFQNNGSVILGTGNTFTNTGWALGRGLSGKSYGQVILGRYNLEDANSQFAFIVGNGINAEDRKTVLGINEDGNSYFSNNIYVNCSDYTTTSSGFTTANCGGSKVATEAYVDAKVPTPPTTDGDYVLKVSVSSGTPTYSWVAE